MRERGSVLFLLIVFGLGAFIPALAYGEYVLAGSSLSLIGFVAVVRIHGNLQRWGELLEHLDFHERSDARLYTVLDEFAKHVDGLERTKDADKSAVDGGH